MGFESLFESFAGSILQVYGKLTLTAPLTFIDAKTQNIDGGNSLDKVLSAVPKLVRSMRMPEKRNDRIR